MERIIGETYRELSRKVTVPGFRKGKVPRKVIDSHLGAEYVRSEAIRNGLPTLYLMGVRDSGILPVSDPEINLLDTDDEETVAFEAKVDVKPEVIVELYKGIVVQKPDTEVTDEDVGEALDEARDRLATLEVVEGRPVEEGDFVLFDYKVFSDGVPLEGSSGSDRMTEVGSGDFIEGFDEQLVGGRKGDILDIHVTFPPEYGEKELAGKPATFRTIVKEIKRKVLPELSDDLARQVSHFETLEEFKVDLGERIAGAKELRGQRQVREEVVKDLVERTDVDLPDSMVDDQVRREVEEFAQELEGRGTTLDEYLEAMKGTRQQLEKGIRESVVSGLKAELVMDAVADAENIEVSDQDAEERIRESVSMSGGDPDKAVKEAGRQGRIPGIRASMRLTRAIDFLVESSVFEGEEPAEESGEEAEGGPADERESTGQTDKSNQEVGASGEAEQPAPEEGKEPSAESKEEADRRSEEESKKS